MDRSKPPLCRGEPRPVRRRTRTFRPNYLSFAGTYQCNLSCPHCCVPIEWPDRLDIGIALRFLEQAHEAGIGVLGFTGGEPFLYPEFLQTLCRRAVQLGFRFAKIMTNGVWHRDAGHLRETRRHPYVGKVFRKGLTAIRDEILARDPEALPGATSNHCYFCWWVLTKGVFDRTREDSADRVGSGGSPWARLRNGRLSLPVL